MSDQKPAESAISNEDKSPVNRVCERFAAGWKAGNAPSFEELLEGTSRESTFLGLLDSMLELAGGNNVSVNADHLQKRFPDMNDIISSRVEETCETIGFQRVITSHVSQSSAKRDSTVDPAEVLGRYRLEKQLGQDGMGTVFLARDTKLDRLVALKMPHFGGDESDVTVERYS